MNGEYLRYPCEKGKEVPYNQLNRMPWDRQKGTRKKEKGEEGREWKRGRREEEIEEQDCIFSFTVQRHFCEIKEYFNLDFERTSITRKIDPEWRLQDISQKNYFNLSDCRGYYRLMPRIFLQNAKLFIDLIKSYKYSIRILTWEVSDILWARLPYTTTTGWNMNPHL